MGPSPPCARHPAPTPAAALPHPLSLPTHPLRCSWVWWQLSRAKSASAFLTHPAVWAPTRFHLGSTWFHLGSTSSQERPVHLSLRLHRRLRRIFAGLLRPRPVHRPLAALRLPLLVQRAAVQFSGEHDQPQRLHVVGGHVHQRGKRERQCPVRAPPSAHGRACCTARPR